MATYYARYHADRYSEVQYRTSNIVRLQFALDEPGLYENVQLIPAPVGLPSWARPMLCDQLFTPNTSFQYLNPDGRRIGYEWLVYGDAPYTVIITINNTEHQYPIPLLPLQSPATFQVHSEHPYTLGGLPATLMEGAVQGVYTAGGIPLRLGKTALRLIALLPMPHRIYKDSQGEWRLMLFNPDGTEYANGAPINLQNLVIDAQLQYR